jgi:putative RNA 2'-phosphotransferase
MASSDQVRRSKFLAYLLRHQPEALNLDMDRAGWVRVDALLRGVQARDASWTRERLEQIVRQSEKNRFALDASGDRIRARYGHSVAVDLGYDPAVPPDVLFHGTPAASVDAICSEGLRPMSRQQVHLSEEVAAARKVARRRGHPVVLRIDAREMHADSFRFYRTESGVWLVDRVPPEYLQTRS